MFTAVAVLQLAAGQAAARRPRRSLRAATRRSRDHDRATAHPHQRTRRQLPRFQRERAELRTPVDYLARFSADPLAFRPGTRAQYSNFGFVVLARIVELASGQPFDATSTITCSAPRR